MSFDNIYVNKNKRKELGVELELEGIGSNFYAKSHLPEKLQKKYIFDQVKDDSVAGDGIEIIFKHFHISSWVPQEIKKIYKTISSFNLHSGETAGMHISYSGPNINSIYDVHKREEDFLDKHKKCGFVFNLFQTIGARTGCFNGTFVYGTDYDTFESAIKDDKILEVRAFQSTTIPEIFYYRLCITHYLLNYVAKKPYDVLSETVFHDMPNVIKNMFWVLTTTENPNKYGFKRDFIYNQLFGKNNQRI